MTAITNIKRLQPAYTSDIINAIEIGKEKGPMLNEIKWIFFDVGSTLIDEHLVYEHILRDIAELGNKKYEYIRIFLQKIKL